MSDEIETIDKNPKSWAAWKREAERLQAIIDDMALAAMDSEPVAWTDAEELSDLKRDGYAAMLSLARKDCEHADPRRQILLFTHPAPSRQRDQVRNEHAKWSQATFGDVGPVGPLKHLSKEALEAAAEPGDLSEWADMQFLLWDAQRRAGITDEQITQALIEKLAVNKQREWPAPKDGEPRLHIKELPAPECQHQWRHGGANKLQNQKQCIKCGRVELDAQPEPVVPDDVQRDAKRWRALLGSARIRILGSAGFDATAHPGENPDYRHFGMEIWTHYPNWLHEKNEYGIDTLTQYADAMLAAAPQEVK